MNILESLDERSRDILLRRIGIKNGAPEMLDEIGKVYGLTRERIRQLEAKAIHELEEKLPNVEGKMKFMAAWQSSASVGAVSAACSITKAHASVLAGTLRRSGFPLKRFPKGGMVPPKPFTKDQLKAIDPRFKSKIERRERFIKLWNSGVSTLAIAKEMGSSCRGSVNSKAHQLRKSGFPLVARGIRSGLKVSHEDFIRAWQTCDSIKEVCDKTGMNYPAVAARRQMLTVKGIELKSYKHAETLTPSVIDRLKKVAAEAFK